MANITSNCLNYTCIVLLQFYTINVMKFFKKVPLILKCKYVRLLYLINVDILLISFHESCVQQSNVMFLCFPSFCHSTIAGNTPSLLREEDA